MPHIMPLCASLRVAALACLLLAATPAWAQHAQHGAAPAASPSTAEFQAASQRMHKAMDIPLTGDPDRDFAAAMIPHHQGAIDMARIQLKYGKDPVLRQMAQEIIAAQEKEISMLKTFLQPGR